MEDKEITAGESVVLPCMASGTPKPTIEWLKDGEPIHTTERHFFTAEDQLMIIVDTLPSDAGTYQCQLNNSLGKEIGFSRLQVKSGKQFYKFLCFEILKCFFFSGCHEYK